MKEEFDLSLYLNHPEGPEKTQELQKNVSKAVSAKQETKQAEQSKQVDTTLYSPISEQALPSEPLNEGNETMRAEYSEQEELQVIPSIRNRIIHKQPQESLESYREAFLTPHKIIDRKAVYLSRITWEQLEFTVRRLGERGANVSSFLERIALNHLEEYADDIERWRKL
ncbi:DUF3408 domain-containing protein [Alloprevotella rava]|uniref:DUF3408 domain-containing protein n=1 Tax=Alloprevotella rava TaxID=671218 RepID=A0A7W5XY27_9BACT|nr:DUF3408 domain-containing protein [Alloprevotella rava]MBB3703088.1 hypothetical protein [Alloprevotella rava]